MRILTNRLKLLLLVFVIFFSCKNRRDEVCILTPDTNVVLFPIDGYTIGVNRNHISHNQDTVIRNSNYQLKKSANITEELLACQRIEPAFPLKRKLYRLGHGPTDGRLDHPHNFMTGYHFEEWWDKTAYPYDDIRYGLREAKLLNADVTMVVNYGTGTPEEAGRLAAYLNKADDKLRNKHGDAPWNVRYFELGNEVTWRSQRGHDPHCLSASGYATRAKEFASAIRANSDIPVKIGLVASINGSFINDDWSNDESGDYMHDMDSLIQVMGDDVDFLIFHNYPSLGFEPEQIMAQTSWLQSKIDQKIQPTINAATQKYKLSHPVKLANTEFNTGRYGKAKHPDVLEALYAADNIITSIKNEMEMAVSFCFSSHGFQGMMFFDNDTLRPTPVFQLHKTMAKYLGDKVISYTAHNVPSFRVDGLVTTQETENKTVTDIGAPGSLLVNSLDFICTKRKDNRIALMILNRSEKAHQLKITGENVLQQQQAKMHLLKGTTYNGLTFSEKELELNIQEEITLPAASIAFVVI